MPNEPLPDLLDAVVIREKLRKPFPPEQVGKLPATAKRPALDYVGHAAVTDRLNTYVPGWSYTIDERFDHGGQCWVRITLDVMGVRRSEYGDGSDPKEALGNAIRRGAMRYGVGIDLWSKEDLEAGAAGSVSLPIAGPVVPETSESATGGGLDADSGNTSLRSDAAATKSVGEGTGAGKPGPSPTDDLPKTAPCDHDDQEFFKDPNTGEKRAARPGFVICSKCGRAEKKAKASLA